MWFLLIWSSRATRFRVQSPQRSGKRGECTQRPLPGRDAERRPSVSGRRASRAEPTTRRRTLALAFVEKNRIGSPLSSQTHGSSSYTTAHCTTPLLLTRPRGACCAPQPSSALLCAYEHDGGTNGKRSPGNWRAAASPNKCTPGCPSETNPGRQGSVVGLNISQAMLLHEERVARLAASMPSDERASPAASLERARLVMCSCSTTSTMS